MRGFQGASACPQRFPVGNSCRRLSPRVALVVPSQNRERPGIRWARKGGSFSSLDSISSMGSGRRDRRVVASAGQQSGASSLDLDAAKELFESKSWIFVDMRTAKEYDYEHITKPVRMTVNVPCESLEEFTSELMKKYRPTAKLLLVDGSGEQGITAAGILQEAGYTACYGVVGGYEAWLKRFTTTGRRRIAGKFVSSGKEALKSGLNLDASVASTYEENHGRADLSLPSNRVQ